MPDSLNVLIVGDGPVTDALGPMVSALGWSPTILITAPAVEPGIDDVVVTSHHDDVDAPTIRAALAAGTTYVGAMGSRRTAWVRSTTASPSPISPPCMPPIGLDIGADEPGEIAVSILAEIVAVRRGRAASVSSISERDGAIHPELVGGGPAARAADLPHPAVRTVRPRSRRR